MLLKDMHVKKALQHGSTQCSFACCAAKQLRTTSGYEVVVEDFFNPPVRINDESPFSLDDNDVASHCSKLEQSSDSNSDHHSKDMHVEDKNLDVFFSQKRLFTKF